MKPLFEADASLHGPGPVKFAWQKDGNYLASVGSNGLLQVFDRHGQVVNEVALNDQGSDARIISLEWDSEGDCLAMLLASSSAVQLYELSTRKISKLDTGMKESLTFASWSEPISSSGGGRRGRVGSVLAVGTAKGNLVLYQKSNRKKIPIKGKHSGAVHCGAWTSDGRLVMGGEDRTLTISTVQGDTVEQTELKAAPMLMCVRDGALNGGGPVESADQEAVTITMSMGKTLLMYDPTDADNPIELAFPPKYGSIVAFKWISTKAILVGFSGGYAAAVSTESDSLGKEHFVARHFKSSVVDVAVAQSMGRAAVCGETAVRVIDTKTWKEVKSDAINLRQRVESMQWTSDGQILSISTTSGTVHSFLTRMPSLSDAHEAEVLYLSSLREITVVNALQVQVERGVPPNAIRIPLETEPTFVALGSMHVIAGTNSTAWAYSIDSRCGHPVGKCIRSQTYLSGVDAVEINHAVCAVLCSGIVSVHLIDPENKQAHESEGGYRHLNSESMPQFPPERDADAGSATCMKLSEKFLIYGTSSGLISFYSLQDNSMLAGCELRHHIGISAVFPNASATRVVFIDATGEGFVYNPVDSHVMPIENFPPGVTLVLWDTIDSHVFVAATDTELCTYAYTDLSIHGPRVEMVGPLTVEDSGDIDMQGLSTELPAGYAPIVVNAGVVTCQMESAQLGRVMLGTHEMLHAEGNGSFQFTSERFTQALALARLKDAWDLALLLKSSAHWLALSNTAMERMDVSMATRVYRELGDAGMVMALEKLKFIEDKHELAGHMLMLFCNYAQAQEMFLLSPAPQEALSMRRDLLHWDQALKLAETLAPEQLPIISIEYAQQLEFKSEYQAALEMYVSAQRGLDEKQRMIDGGELMLEDELEELAQRQRKCFGGIARMTLRVGNIPKGVQMVLRDGDAELCKECADILVGLKQGADAAKLYLKAECYEEAASIYILAKDFRAAAPLMKNIKSSRLHLQYARAKEGERDFEEAAIAFERAGDMDSVVRIYLQHLGRIQKGFAIVRETGSAEAANIAARHCQGVNDFKGAIEFLLMANRAPDAFEVATAHDQMEIFEDVLGDKGTTKDYEAIAKYYETKHNMPKAAHYYSMCTLYHKALKLYMQSNEEYIDKAIEVVGKARSDMLTHSLIDFLMGEADGVPKDPKYIFRLYMALGNYPQAAKTAMIIARQEQQVGNYKIARNTLYETYHELEVRNIKVPLALRKSLLLLHSYLIVKKLIRMKAAADSARMLLRVAQNISQFPSHQVQILTSTVIQCARAGLKKSSHEYASILMRPEYRSSIDEKFKRKIEGIVRKRGSAEDLPEEMTENPYTGELLECTALVCPTTHNVIPFCIVTGQHMVLNDWCICPNSQMPALYSKYVKYLESCDPKDRVDPMLGRPISVQQLRKADDPRACLEKFKAQTSGVDDDDDEDSDDRGLI